MKIQGFGLGNQRRIGSRIPLRNALKSNIKHAEVEDEVVSFVVCGSRFLI